MLTAPAPVRCAVLGSPIAHSLSPVLHRAAYAELGLDWSYAALEVTEEELPGFLQGLDEGWRGLSLTMPLKRAVMSELDSVDARAVEAGAANTVVLDQGRRHGHNTDVPGAVAAISERIEAAPTTAVVLGGGATATSVLLALADLGCRSATVLVREPERAAATVAAVSRHPTAPALEVAPLGGDQPTGSPDLVVSTIPAGAQDAAVLALVARARAAFEVRYDPWPTPMAVAAYRAGIPLVTGLDLLVHQAARQVELMTGAPASIQRMRVAGEQALAARSSETAPTWG